jgi:hypothetical protein
MMPVKAGGNHTYHAGLYTIIWDSTSKMYLNLAILMILLHGWTCFAAISDFVIVCIIRLSQLMEEA